MVTTTGVTGREYHLASFTPSMAVSVRIHTYIPANVGQCLRNQRGRESINSTRLTHRACNAFLLLSEANGVTSTGPLTRATCGRAHFGCVPLTPRGELKASFVRGASVAL